MVMSIPTKARHGKHLQLLLDHTPEAQHEALIKWVYSYCNTLGHDTDESFLGFLDDYLDLAHILERHTIITPKGLNLKYDLSALISDHVWTVYDIGCASALQHVFFPFATKYIGIDQYSNEGQQFFRSNCEFIKGNFADIYKDLNINRNTSFGIANMSFLYDRDREGNLAAFDACFKHKYVI